MEVGINFHPPIEQKKVRGSRIVGFRYSETEMVTENYRHLKTNRKVTEMRSRETTGDTGGSSEELL